MNTDMERALHDAMEDAVFKLEVAPSLASTVKLRARHHLYRVAAVAALLIFGISVAVPVTILPILRSKQDVTASGKQPLVPSSGGHPLAAGLSCFSVSSGVRHVDVNAPLTNGGEVPLTITAIIGQSPGLRLSSVTQQKSCNAPSKGTVFKGVRLEPGQSTAPLGFRFLAVNCGLATPSLTVLVYFQLGHQNYSQLLELPHGTDEASNRALGGGACTVTSSP